MTAYRPTIRHSYGHRRLLWCYGHRRLLWCYGHRRLLWWCAGGLLALLAVGDVLALAHLEALTAAALAVARQPLTDAVLIAAPLLPALAIRAAECGLHPSRHAPPIIARRVSWSSRSSTHTVRHRPLTGAGDRD